MELEDEHCTLKGISGNPRRYGTYEKRILPIFYTEKVEDFTLYLLELYRN